MLQQTRVETAVRYFEPFLLAFPTVEALAAASEDELMKRWEGLGYYRRARYLHAGAGAVVDQHGGELPRTRDALLGLPGFGPYTAGAVASLAFGEAVPAVDGNVLRVFARQSGYDADITSPRARRDAETFVMRHQPVGNAGAFNEALMELGATVCTPRSPQCARCPIARSCASPGERLPVKAARPKVPTVRVALALARRGDRVLLEKRATGLLAGTWGLPWVEAGPESLRKHVEALAGGRALVGAVAARGRHVFTHRVWQMRAFEVDIKRPTRGEWRRPTDVALGTAHRRLLASAVAK